MDENEKERIVRAFETLVKETKIAEEAFLKNNIMPSVVAMTIIFKILRASLEYLSDSLGQIRSAEIICADFFNKSKN